MVFRWIGTLPEAFHMSLYIRGVMNAAENDFMDRCIRFCSEDVSFYELQALFAGCHDHLVGCK